jgi:NADH-quinone oxidoreductase subunit G
MAEMVRLKIDGEEVEVEKGTPVIQAAFKTGAAVPHYCYHPGLTIAGNCRMCLVEIEKMPKLVTSCTTPAADGMVVSTNSEKVKAAVAGVEEFLLANHPLDCPICDQAGECRLQDYSFKHGKAASRFREDRLQFKKGVDVGRHVVLDCERCIMCTRCVRFCEEIPKTGELGVFQRGLHNEIGIFPGHRLDNAYSGNVVDICPVGALTLKELRFRKRVWFIRDVPSVCGTCANGCNVNLGTSQNDIWRLTPRENPMVNGWWICDEGRLSYQLLKAAGRITGPESLEKGAYQPLRLSSAVTRVGGLLRAEKSKAAIVASGNLTVEDLWLLKRLVTEAVPGLEVLIPESARGEDDGFLIRADKTANRKGAEILGFDVDAGGESTKALMAEISSGRISTVLSLGEDLSRLPGGKEALAKLKEGGALLFVGPYLHASSEAAHMRMPALAYGEFEGTWVTFKGRAQRVRRAVTPRVAALPYWQVLSMILAKFDLRADYANAAQVLREMAGEVAAFEGVTWTALGAQGIPLKLGEHAAPSEPAPKGLPEPSWVAHG